jgi:arabinose-5-phosphate isomerase
MHRDDRVPRVPADASLRDALVEMTAKGLGLTAVVDADGRAIGVFTDGDLRRVLDRGVDVRAAAVSDVMTPGGVSIEPQRLAAEAAHLMQERKINCLLVNGEEGGLIGALNMHDLLRAGVV